MAQILIVFVKAYQLLLSPLLPFNHCSYAPSCSEYAVEALTKHGWLRGSWLAFRRILRCHPFHKHPVYDPVPDKR